MVEDELAPTTEGHDDDTEDAPEPPATDPIPETEPDAETAPGTELDAG